MTNNVFEIAKQKALSNDEDVHLAAVLIRNNHTVRIGTNQQKTHPKFTRYYPDGTCRSHLHAEMDVLRFSKPGDVIFVMRFDKDGALTMSKPCKYCQQHIKDFGIKTVHYSDWEGEMVKWNVKNAMRD